LFYFQVAAAADKRDALLAGKGNISTSIFLFLFLFLFLFR